MLQLLLFPVSVEAPHFRRSFWKTAVRTLKRGIQCALSRDSQFRQRTAALRARRPPRSIEPAPPIGKSPIPRRLENLQISSAPNFFGSNAKHFQISVVPMPSFSKDSFGGFVGFQRVALDPNRKIASPNYCPPNRARKAVPRPINSASCRASCMHATGVSAFRKKMSILCRGETRHRRRRANGHEWDSEIV
jgi:hypothetical protein